MNDKFNERYKITDQAKGIIRKLDMNNEPDLDGAEYRIIDKVKNGYTVVQVLADPSQPSSVLFIDEAYFKER